MDYRLFPLAFLGALAAAQNLRSPYKAHAEVEAYVETSTHRYLVDLDLDAMMRHEAPHSGFNVHIIDKTTHATVSYPVTDRAMYLDGGTRVIRFETPQGTNIIYIPHRPGETSLDSVKNLKGLGKFPVLQTPKGNIPLSFSAVGSGSRSEFPQAPVHAADKAAVDRMMDLYSENERMEYRSLNKKPTIDSRDVMDEIRKQIKREEKLSPINDCLRRLGGLFGRK